MSETRSVNQFIFQVWQNSKYNEQWWQDNKAVKCTNSCPRKTQVKSNYYTGLMVRNKN